MKFLVEFYDADEFRDKLEKISLAHKAKVIRTIRAVEDMGIEYIDVKFINDDIYEMRISHGNNEFRLLFFYHRYKRRVIVVTNTFVKKDQKLPLREKRKQLQTGTSITWTIEREILMKSEINKIYDEWIAENPEVNTRIYQQVSAEMDFAISLKKLRLAMEMNQAEVAVISGIKQSEISKIENAVINPTIGTVLRYLDCFGYTLDIKPKNS